MARNATESPIPALKLDAGTWSRIVESLRLSPQQARIVEMILEGLCDKQIASALGLTVPTIRTHLGRIFQRNGLEDRIELILRAFAVAHAAWLGDGRHH